MPPEELKNFAGAEPMREHCSHSIRRRAKQMHEEAVNLDKLADSLQHISGEAEEVLNNIIWQALFRKM